MSQKPPRKQVVAIPQYSADQASLLVPVTRRALPQPDGSTKITAQVEMGSAPVPDRRYVADVAAVAVAPAGQFVTIMFGQSRIGSKALRSLVLIRLFPEPVHRFFEGSAEFITRLRNTLSKNKLDEQSVEPTLEEPEQTVSLSANVVATAYAGHEAVLDFYHLSPMVLRRLALQDEPRVPLDPVVRIDISIALLAGVVTALEAAQPGLPKGDFEE